MITLKHIFWGISALLLFLPGCCIQLGRNLWKKQVAVGPLEEDLKFYVSPGKTGAQIKKDVISKSVSVLSPAPLV